MGGGKGGKGGGGSSINVQPSPYEQALADMSRQYYTKTDPLRNMFYQDFGQFLRPGMSSEYNPYGRLSVYEAEQPYMSSPYSTAGGTSGPGGTQTVGGTSFSNNFNIPSASDIANNVTLAYGNMGGAPYANAQQGRQYLQNLGYNFEPTNIPEMGTPAWDSFVSNKANEIRTNALINAQASSQKGTATSGGSSASPYSSSNAYDPYNLPAFAPLYQLSRTGLESQYGQARQNILSSLPRGGGLAENLANLEMSRAQQAGALPATIAAPIIQDIYNKAYGSAFGAPQTAMGGMSGAASTYAQQYGSQGAYQAAQAAQAQQSGLAGAAGLGSLVGLGVKAAMK